MKAILVIDEMPKSCDACPLTYIDYGDDAYYGANTTRCVIDKDIIPLCGKWDECPLKPMPTYDWHEEGKENECEEWYRNGWNDCIDAIISDTDGTKGEK